MRVLELVEQLHYLLGGHVGLQLVAEQVLGVSAERAQPHSGLRWVGDGLCHSRGCTFNLVLSLCQQVGATPDMTAD